MIEARKMKGLVPVIQPATFYEPVEPGGKKPIAQIECVTETVYVITELS